MAISSPGIGSNLDVNSIVTQLMALEQRPLVQLARKEAGYQAQLTAFGSLKGAISSFQTTLSGLRSLSRFDAFRAQTGNAAVITATGGNSAAAGNYTVAVGALAQSHVLQAAGVASITAASSTGAITLQAGSGAIHTITIGAGNNTLTGVRDAINAAQSDVQAIIVNDGTANPYRLVLTAASGGTANTISVNNTLTAGAIKDAFDGITQAQAAVDASVTVNGVVITGASNTLSEAIPGITLQLAGVGSSTLSVTRDTAVIQTAVQSFVKSYNDLSGTVANLTAYNATTKQAGPLVGNSSARGIQTQLRAALSSALPGLTGSITNLSAIGVAFSPDGSLTLDATKLDAAIAADPGAVGALFALRSQSESSLLEYVGSGANAAVGRYEVHVDVVATQAATTATAAPAASTVIDGTNDTFSFELDGVASGSLQIAQGTYTEAELAVALQAAIDSSAELETSGAGATVSLSGGKLAITSARFGTVSTIAALAGNALVALGFSGSETATGADITGHFLLGEQLIAATGSGQTLTAAAGGSADALTILFSGDATQLQAGADAVLNLSEGHAVVLNRLANQFLETSGPIDSRTQGIGRTIVDIGRQRDRLNLRLIGVEARIRAQFTALDTLIGRLTTTSNFLQQQLSRLPGVSNSQN